MPQTPFPAPEAVQPKLAAPTAFQGTQIQSRAGWNICRFVITTFRARCDAELARWTR